MLNWLVMNSDTVLWCGFWGSLLVVGLYTDYRESREKATNTSQH